MNTKIRTVALALFPFFSLQSARASPSEIPVVFDRVELSSMRDLIDVIISKADPERLDVKVRVRSKTVQIDERYLFGAKDVIMESVRLVGTDGSFVKSNKPILPGDLVTYGFAVSFEFGGTYEHGSKEPDSKTVLVHKVIRLYFKNGEFTEAELAVPKGNFVNKWEIFAMPKDGIASEKPYEERIGIERPW